MAHNPYVELEPKSFWKKTVSSVNPLEIEDLWSPKFKISKKDAVVSFGSCFAQHMSRALVKNNFNWLNCEPGIGSAEGSLLKEFNYGIFSARTGNIYTAKQLYQWVSWAFDEESCPRDYVWEKEGRFYDPFRPNIEPLGFSSKEELLKSRAVLLQALRDCFLKAKVFVFTLGLTEGWECAFTGVNFALAPGVVAGEFDESTCSLKNYGFLETYKYMESTIKFLENVNPELVVLLTVSPVPLMATATDDHVLVANSYSKSVLRSVAGEVCKSFDSVDYFPSYEIVTAHPFRGMFYNPDLRTISPKGVEHIMDIFISNLAIDVSVDVDSVNSEEVGNESGEVVCEEELIAAFGTSKEKGDH